MRNKFYSVLEEEFLAKHYKHEWEISSFSILSMNNFRRKIFSLSGIQTILKIQILKY